MRITEQQARWFDLRSLAKVLRERLQQDSAQLQEDQARGQLRIIDACGHTTTLAYAGDDLVITSPLGRRWSMRSTPSQLSLKGPTGAELLFTQHADHRTSIKLAGEQVLHCTSDPKRYVEIEERVGGARLQQRYDVNGRPFEVTLPGGGCERYQYDGHGMLLGVLDAREHATFFTREGADAFTTYADFSQQRVRHDASGRPRELAVAGPGAGLHEEDADGAAEPVAWSVMAELDYDDGDRLAAIRCHGGDDVAIDYDSDGRLIACRCGETENRFQYRADGKVGVETYGPHAIERQYDDRGLLSAVVMGEESRRYEQRYEYDADGRVSRVGLTQALHCLVHYAADGRAVTVELPNGLSYTVQLDRRELIERIVTRDETGSAWHQLVYEMNDARRQAVLQATHGTFRYRYDEDGQLLSMEQDGGAREQRRYDPAGNCIRSETRAVPDAPAVVHEAQYDALNRVVRYGERQFEHDDCGNLTADRGPQQHWQYSYDGRNQLVAARCGDSLITFAYDGFGRRVRKANGESSTQYIWSGDRIIREIHRSAQTERVRDYYYLPGAYVPLAMCDDGAWYFFHCDRIGTPLRLSDAYGQVAWEARYTAFGERVELTEGVTQPFCFPGQLYDAETELHYNRHRYYDPTLGRYLSRDPLGIRQDRNLYRYAGNNPITRYDVHGASWWGFYGEIFAILGGLLIMFLVLMMVPLPTAGAIVVGGATAIGVQTAISTVLNERGTGRAVRCRALRNVVEASSGSLVVTAPLALATLTPYAPLVFISGIGSTAIYSQWFIPWISARRRSNAGHSRPHRVILGLGLASARRGFDRWAWDNGAVIYWYWFVAGYNFAGNLRYAMEQADAIYFNTAGLEKPDEHRLRLSSYDKDSYGYTYQRSPRSSPVPLNGFTRFELWTLYNNPELLKKVTWYLGNDPAPCSPFSPRYQQRDPPPDGGGSGSILPI